MARGAIGAATFLFGATPLATELSTITMNFDVPPADITAFTDVTQNVVAGKPSAKLDMTGSYDPAAAEGDIIIFAQLGAAAGIYNFKPDGTTGYDGYGVVTSYSITASTTDACKYSLSMQHNGSAAAGGQAPSRAP